jgi:hypothetical protein
MTIIGLRTVKGFDVAALQAALDAADADPPAPPGSP